MTQCTRTRHNSWKPSITSGKQHCLHCSLTTTTQAHCIIVSSAGQQPRASHNCLHCWSAATSHPLLLNNHEPTPLSPMLVSNHEPVHWSFNPCSQLLLAHSTYYMTMDTQVASRWPCSTYSLALHNQTVTAH